MVKLVDVCCSGCGLMREEFVENTAKFGEEITGDPCECGETKAVIGVSAPDIRTENSHTLLEGTRDNFDGGQLTHTKRVIAAQAAYQQAKYKKIGNAKEALDNLKEVSRFKT